MFRSELWRILTNPNLTLDDYRAIIGASIARSGWYRANHADCRLAGIYFGEDPAFGVGWDQDNVYSTMLTSIEGSPSAD